jgi:integrase/recombinase XerD
VDEDLLGGFRSRVFVGSFDELAGLEGRAGADERDQVGCVERAPAVLCGLDELERHCQARGT